MKKSGKSYAAISQPKEEAMNVDSKSKIVSPDKMEFVPAAWPGCSATGSPGRRPARLTAEIVTAKGVREFEGQFVACRIQQGVKHYLVLSVEQQGDFADILEGDSNCCYLAFQSDWRIDPVRWHRGSWHEPPHLMCKR